MELGLNGYLKFTMVVANEDFLVFVQVESHCIHSRKHGSYYQAEGETDREEKGEVYLLNLVFFQRDNWANILFYFYLYWFRFCLASGFG